MFAGLLDHNYYEMSDDCEWTYLGEFIIPITLSEREKG